MTTKYCVWQITEDGNGEESGRWIEVKDMPGVPVPVRTTAERDSMAKIKGCNIFHDELGRQEVCDGMTWKGLKEDE